MLYISHFGICTTTTKEVELVNRRCVCVYICIALFLIIFINALGYRPTSVEITSNSRWNLSGQPSYKGKYTYTYVNRYLHPTEGNFMDAAESKVRVRKRTLRV